MSTTTTGQDSSHSRPSEDDAGTGDPILARGEDAGVCEVEESRGRIDEAGVDDAGPDDVERWEDGEECYGDVEHGASGVVGGERGREE